MHKLSDDGDAPPCDLLYYLVAPLPRLPLHHLLSLSTAVCRCQVVGASGGTHGVHISRGFSNTETSYNIFDTMFSLDFPFNKRRWMLCLVLFSPCQPPFFGSNRLTNQLEENLLVDKMESRKGGEGGGSENTICLPFYQLFL